MIRFDWLVFYARFENISLIRAQLRTAWSWEKPRQSPRGNPMHDHPIDERNIEILHASLNAKNQWIILQHDVLHQLNEKATIPVLMVEMTSHSTLLQWAVSDWLGLNIKLHTIPRSWRQIPSFMRNGSVNMKPCGRTGSSIAVNVTNLHGKYGRCPNHCAEAVIHLLHSPHKGERRASNLRLSLMNRLIYTCESTRDRPWNCHSPFRLSRKKFVNYWRFFFLFLIRQV